MNILVYTNILSPYRKHFFDSVYDLCVKEGHNFNVAVMAPTESNRNWKYDQFKADYTYLLHSKTISYKEIYIHFNSNLKKYLLSVKPDVVICAGSYLSPGINDVFKLKKKIGYKVIFWSESHLNEHREYSKFKLLIREKIRNTFYKRFDGFFYAGKLSLDFIDKYANNSVRYFLPNLVDEQVFHNVLHIDEVEKNSTKSKYNIDLDKVVLFCPARLSPVKGLVEFINILKFCKNKNNVTLLVAGDGPLKEKIIDLAKIEELDIRVIGYKDQSEIIKLYSIADVFLLPSLSDPNPLTCIEAIWCGLPLIVSNHVGNYPEIVAESINGYVIDYNDINNSMDKIDAIIEADDIWRASARQKSVETAHAIYSTNSNTSRLINFLKSFIAK